MQRGVALIGLLVLTACRAAPPREPVALGVSLATQEVTLQNGLRVVLRPDATASSVAVRIRYHVGSKDDPVDREGLAHLFEHLMFRSAKRTAPYDYAQRIALIGGAANAETTVDATDYFETVPPSSAAIALWLEASRMAHPLDGVGDAELSNERDVVKNELRERFERDPSAVARAFARDALFGSTHPYAHSPIGRLATLDRVHREDLTVFAQRYHRPNNATLVVCGAFDPATIIASINQSFGRITPGPVVWSSQSPVVAPATPRTEVRSSVDAVYVAVGWPGPAPERDGFTELELAIVTLQTRGLVRLSAGGVSDEISFAMDAGHFGSFVSAVIKRKPAANPDDALARLDEAIAETSRIGRMYEWPGFPDYRLAQVTTWLLPLASVEGQAWRIQHDLEYNHSADGIAAVVAGAQQVPASDVGTAVEQFLTSKRRAIAVVRPESGGGS